uniref:hypothetical protein n=1 Tax=Nonomuraea sp. CA-252377 TaxID=3240003 RepID=UPI003F497680
MVNTAKCRRADHFARFQSLHVITPSAPPVHPWLKERSADGTIVGTTIRFEAPLSSTSSSTSWATRMKGPAPARSRLVSCRLDGCHPGPVFPQRWPQIAEAVGVHVNSRCLGPDRAAVVTTAGLVESVMSPSRVEENLPR